MTNIIKDLPHPLAIEMCAAAAVVVVAVGDGGGVEDGVVWNWQTPASKSKS